MKGISRWFSLSITLTATVQTFIRNAGLILIEQNRELVDKKCDVITGFQKEGTMQSSRDTYPRSITGKSKKNEDQENYHLQNHVSKPYIMCNRIFLVTA